MHGDQKKVASEAASSKGPAAPPPGLDRGASFPPVRESLPSTRGMESTATPSSSGAGTAKGDFEQTRRRVPQEPGSPDRDQNVRGSRKTSAASWAPPAVRAPSRSDDRACADTNSMLGKTRRTYVKSEPGRLLWAFPRRDWCRTSSCTRKKEAFKLRRLVQTFGVESVPAVQPLCFINRGR